MCNGAGVSLQGRTNMTTKRLFKNVLCMSTSFTPQKPEPPMARPGGPRSREALNAEGANHQAPCFSAKLALFVTGCAENGGNHPILGPSDSWPPSVCPNQRCSSVCRGVCPDQRESKGGCPRTEALGVGFPWREPLCLDTYVHLGSGDLGPDPSPAL